MDLTTEQIERLSLLILGAALAKRSDKDLLKSFPPENLPQEFGDVLAGIQNTDVAVVRSYCEKIGAPLADGRGAIQSAAESLIADASRKKIRQILKTIEYGASGLTTIDLAKKLRGYADELEGTHYLIEGPKND